VKAAGWKLVYTPRASVLHVAAPYPKGQRFDIRYTYYAARNHVVLLVRTRGLSSRELRGFLGVAAAEATGQLRRAARAATGDSTAGTGSRSRAVAGGLTRGLAELGGLAVGLVAGIEQQRRDRTA